ncbi:Expansin-like A3-like protein, partial [Drosera capensis]
MLILQSKPCDPPSGESSPVGIIYRDMLYPKTELLLYYKANAVSLLDYIPRNLERASSLVLLICMIPSSTWPAAGECGYGPLALRFNGGYLAAGDASLFKNGAGCGTCLQARWRESLLCTTVGTKVILTDHNISNNTGLVLSRHAFASMAKEGMEQSLFALGIMDLEYKRIPCNYKHRNLTLMMRDFSIFPNYLAIEVLYRGGQTEILGIDVAQVGAYNWVYLSRNYGVVWDTSSAPPGPLQFRFTVTDGYDGSFVLAKNALPADWNHPGVLYDTGVQITSIAQESCAR